MKDKKVDKKVFFNKRMRFKAKKNRGKNEEKKL